MLARIAFGFDRLRLIAIGSMPSSLALILGTTILFGAGCNKEAKPEAAPAKTAEPAAAQPAATGEEQPAPKAAASGERKYNEPNFDLSIEAPPATSAGKPTEATIVLVAKSPFHVNQSYPYKFKIKAADGLKSEKPVWSSEAVKLENQRAVMTVGFTPEAAGKKKLAGQFAFSVCTDDKCLIEKRDLALELDTP